MVVVLHHQKRKQLLSIVPCQITLLGESFSSDFVAREFLVKNLGTQEQRKIYQLHCIWPDFGVPSYSTMSGMLRCVDKIQSLQTGEPRPLLVHCSAGLGRAGTFIFIHTLLCLASQTHSNYSELDFVGILRNLRTQRHGLVQTWEQYQFAKQFVEFSLRKDVNMLLEEPMQIESKRKRSRGEESMAKRPRLNS